MVPRSGYVSKPRVVSTLGKQVHIVINPERVAPVGRNRVAVELAIKFCNPGLPRQPWALRRHRVAVKQFKSEDYRDISKRLAALQT